MNTASKISALVDRYMDILGIASPRPVVIVRDNLGSKWLGRCSYRPGKTDTTTIEIQRSVLAHENTLERVLAHEMVHHVECLTLSKGDLALFKLGVDPPTHGDRFLEIAAVVNDVMGEDFVTVESDSSYVTEPSSREFYLYVEGDLVSGDRVGWAWAQRLSPQTESWVRGKLRLRRSKLVKSSDGRWTRGTKLKKFGGLSIAERGSDDEKLILQILVDDDVAQAII